MRISTARPFNVFKNVPDTSYQQYSFSAIHDRGESLDVSRRVR